MRTCDSLLIRLVFGFSCFLVLPVIVGCSAGKPLAPPKSNSQSHAVSTGTALGNGAAAAPEAPSPTADRSGSITIVLDMEPDNPGDISFLTRGWKMQDFSLDDDSDPGLPNTRTFDQLKPGTYVIQEVQAAVGTLVQINIDGGAGGNEADLLDRTATINLESGESVVCTFRIGWTRGDFITYKQQEWGEPGPSGAYAMLTTFYFGVYPSTIFEVGVPGTDGFSMVFTDPYALINYLPATGPPAPLDADYFNPTSTPSAGLGGVVTALKLDVDFSDKGFLPRNSSMPFGDLRLCNFTTMPRLNGLTVRRFLAVANTALGGCSYSLPYSIEEIALITRDLTHSFIEGEPSQFAREHLFIGDCP